MIATTLLKMLALFFLVGLVAATSASNVINSSAAQCQTGCHAFFTGCLNRHEGADFCRDFVCEYYGDKCQACQACGPAVPQSYEFTAGIDVKRETQEAKSYCIIACLDATCRHMCLKDESEMPKDLDGALVINEADLDNRTVAIKMEGTDESQAGGQRRCIHWVCVLRNCYYAECQAQGQTEEVAHLATLEVMAQDGDVQASPEGCRQFCNDSDQGMCITLCAPSGIEKSSAGPTPPPQPRNTCEMICMDKMCFLVCLPPHASANIERRSSHSASANIEKRSPLLYCILRCVADMCWVLCSPHSASVNVEKRSHYSVSANVEKRSPIGCIRRCVADMCWLLCSPHSASAKREVEDDVANN